MKTNLIPVFDGRVNFFTVPQGLVGDEAQSFLKIVQTIEDKVDDADEDAEVVDCIFAKNEMSKSVFDAVVALCKLAGMKVKFSQSEEEYILAIFFFE